MGHEADDVPLDRLSDALVGLAEGRYAGKVMVVPRLSEGAQAERVGVEGERWPTPTTRPATRTSTTWP